MPSNSEPSALRSVVQEAIYQGHLGTPKFLRCMAQADGPDGLRPTLDSMLFLAEGWFGAHPVQRHRLGTQSKNYMAELLKWPDGQGALLAVSSHSSPPTPALDLLLVGSRGTLYHES